MLIGHSRVIVRVDVGADVNVATEGKLLAVKMGSARPIRANRAHMYKVDVMTDHLTSC